MLSPEELIRVTNAVRHWDALTSPSAESAMTQLTDLLARIRDALGSGTTDAGEVSARIAALVPAEVKQGIPGFLDRHGLAVGMPENLVIDAMHFAVLQRRVNRTLFDGIV